jgi:hypothetical protein
MTQFGQNLKQQVVHQRDEKDNLIPQWITISTLDKTEKQKLGVGKDDEVELLVKPVTQGQLNSYINADQQNSDTDQVNDEDIEFITNHIIDPETYEGSSEPESYDLLFDPSDLTEDLKEYEIVVKLIAAILEASTGQDQKEVVERMQGGGDGGESF